MTKEFDAILDKLEEAKNSATQAITDACEASAYASQAETQAIEAHDAIRDAIDMLEEMKDV
jgi:hypothetical protein